jgi:hypothetical protein
LKCCKFLWVRQRHNCSPAASFANCVMTLYLLKVHLQTFLFTPITQKCQILSCDTLVANERYICWQHSTLSSGTHPLEVDTGFLVCHARWCSKCQMSGICDGHLMAFCMLLSFKFPSPAHRTWHFIPVPESPRLKLRVPAGFFTRWCTLPVCTVATLFNDQCWTRYWHGCHLIKVVTNL